MTVYVPRRQLRKLSSQHVLDLKDYATCLSKDYTNIEVLCVKNEKQGETLSAL